MEKVNEYLDRMKIKKTFFRGLNETDVYKVIDKVCSIYEEEIEDRDSLFKVKVEENEQLTVELNSVKKKLSEKTGEKDKILSQAQIIQKRYNEKVRENEHLSSIISSYSLVQEELRVKGEKDAMKIREEAKKEALLIIKTAKQEKEEMELQLFELEAERKRILQGLKVVQQFCVRTHDAVKEIQSQQNESGIDKVSDDELDKIIEMANEVKKESENKGKKSEELKNKETKKDKVYVYKNNENSDCPENNNNDELESFGT